jgi:hypothetical protein
MNFINERKIEAPKKTRMWFTKEQIYTPALKKLMKGNMSTVAQEIEYTLKEAFVKFDTDELKFTLSDIVDFLTSSNIRTSKSYISKRIKEHFKLESTNGSYTKFIINSNDVFNLPFDQVTSKGRYFTFRKEDFDDD